MATKKKKDLPAKKTTDRSRAKAALWPSTNAAVVIEEYAKPFGEFELSDLWSSLKDAIEAIQGGNMGRCEAMLVGQAHALQSMFMNFSRRAIQAEHMPKLETYFKLALKAQNQCRMTLETLSTIKNPPTVFAKQANIAHGPQQINNALPADGTPAREEKTITSNELLITEQEKEGFLYGAPVDVGGTSETIATGATLPTSD